MPKSKQQSIINNMGQSEYFAVISNGCVRVTRADGHVKYSVHEPGAIGAGTSPNGEYFVVGYKDRATIYRIENGGVYRHIHFSGCNVIGVSFASNDSVVVSCTNGQSGLYGLDGGKIRSL